MSRRERERAILEIVTSRPIHTQAELVRALSRRGIRVTQATVSRDIQRLGLVKLPLPEGGHRYASPEAVNGLPPSPTAREALEAAFREFVTGLDAAQGIVVIHTETGCANAVAVAIDEAGLPGVVATLAGDDTIFVLPRTAADVETVLRELASLR